MKMWKKLTIFFLKAYIVTAIQRKDMFPYGTLRGDLTLREGDGSSEILELKKPMYFYESQFSKLYVAVNGLISTQPLPTEDQYLDHGFPYNFPIIAPFLADIDTSNGRGAVYYRSEGAAGVLNRVSRAVRRGFPGARFAASHAVVATWENVGAHRGSTLPDDVVNTFQVVLAYDETDSYALFLYPEDGLRFFGTRLKASHVPKLGLPARVGFSRGDVPFLLSSHMGPHYSVTSTEKTVRNLCHAGNTGVPGLWLFHIGHSFFFQNVVPAAVASAFPSATPAAREAGASTPDYSGQFRPVGPDRPPPMVRLDPNFPHKLPHAESLRSYYPPSGNGAEGGTSLPGGNPDLALCPSKESCPPLVFSVDDEDLENSTRVFQYDTDVKVTCVWLQPLCSQDSYCTEYPTGVCCHCRSGFYGNGWNCLPEGVPQRVNGKVSGLLFVGSTPIKLSGVDLHTYIVVEDGRAYTTISQVPEPVGWALLPVAPLGTLFGWLFALELQGHQNGFSITGAEFTCHSEVIFYPGNQRLTIIQKVQDMDSHHSLRLDTTIHGQVPSIPPGAKVQMEPYKETYQHYPSAVTSLSVREYTMVSAEGESETFSYQLHQNVTYRSCQHGLWTIPDAQQLNVELILAAYMEEERALRYAVRSSMGPVGADPREIAQANPCSAGTHDCSVSAHCLPGEGARFICQCALGYQGDGRSCFDVDECSEGLSICGAHSECVNIAGGHLCQCQSGFEFRFDSHTCVDIDECLSQLCHPHASCSNYPGSFECRCEAGFEGDGFLCLPRRAHPEPPLSPCERHRDMLQEGLKLQDGWTIVEAFVPQCDQDGQYRPLQCQGSTGHCWCVDSRGQERAGTRTLPGMLPTICDQSAPPPSPRETACERWRATLMEHYGGQPAPHHYLPQCDSMGQFSPVQCYGDSTFCWCVDSDGREVIGTRSHDIIKPACISTVAPPTEPHLSRPDMTEPPHGPALLYTQGHQIGVLPLDGSQLEKKMASVLLTLQGSIVVGIDYDCQEKRVYWTDLAGRTISRARLEPRAQPEIVINSGLTCPEGLAVDTLRRTMVWVDSGTDRIETSSLDGSNRRVLFDTDLVNPRAIVVDSADGSIYWTDWNREAPKIESCTVLGHDRKVLVRDGIGLPNALTFDPLTRDLCWADAGTKRLECIAPDGTGRREISCHLNYPFGLAVCGSQFYYTDWSRNGVLVLSENSSHFTDEYLPDQRSHVYGVTVSAPQCSSG